jgi:hypothetical protein
MLPLALHAPEVVGTLGSVIGDQLPAEAVFVVPSQHLVPVIDLPQGLAGE